MKPVDRFSFARRGISFFLPGLLLAAFFLVQGCGRRAAQGPSAQETVVLVKPPELFPSYEGEVQGVMLSANPNLRLLSVSLPLAGGMVPRAFQLDRLVRTYPPGTVFLVFGGAVPGREGLAVAVKTKAGHILVGPDSGIFTRVLEREEVEAYCHIKAPEILRGQGLNSLFPERDVYAPVAAALANGESLEKWGAPGASLVKIPLPRAANAGASMNGQVLYVSWDGRLVTNFPLSAFEIVKPGQLLRFSTEGKVFTVVYLTNETEAPPGRPFGICNADGFFEIGILDANAAQAMKLAPGQKLSVR